MTTHGQAKSLRNVCFKISKLGSNTDQYNILRQTLLDTPGHLGRFTPGFIVSCETPKAVRDYLAELIPADEKRAVYKRRRQFLEQEFAEIIYWSERDALSPIEIGAFNLIDCEDRATMDHVIQLIRDCVETDPRRSMVVSRHTVLNAASYLLESNGMRTEVTADVQHLFEQIIHMAEHPSADQDILFCPDRSFMASVMPLVTYIDKQDKYYSWEEGNRTPDYPTVQIARHICQAVTLLCDILWQWTFDNTYRSALQIDDVEEGQDSC